jgi:hypothetical protein
MAATVLSAGPPLLSELTQEGSVDFDPLAAFPLMPLPALPKIDSALKVSAPTPQPVSATPEKAVIAGTRSKRTSTAKSASAAPKRVAIVSPEKGREAAERLEKIGAYTAQFFKEFYPKDSKVRYLGGSTKKTWETGKLPQITDDLNKESTIEMKNKNQIKLKNIKPDLNTGDHVLLSYHLWGKGYYLARVSELTKSGQHVFESLESHAVKAGYKLNATPDALLKIVPVDVDTASFDAAKKAATTPLGK